MDKLSIRYIKIASVFIFALIVLAMFARNQLTVLVEEKEQDIQTEQILEVIKKQEEAQKIEQQQKEEQLRLEQEQIEQQRQEQERIRLEEEQQSIEQDDYQNNQE